MSKPVIKPVTAGGLLDSLPGLSPSYIVARLAQWPVPEVTASSGLLLSGGVAQAPGRLGARVWEYRIEVSGRTATETMERAGQTALYLSECVARPVWLYPDVPVARDPATGLGPRLLGQVTSMTGWERDRALWHEGGLCRVAMTAEITTSSLYAMYETSYETPLPTNSGQTTAVEQRVGNAIAYPRLRLAFSTWPSTGSMQIRANGQTLALAPPFNYPSGYVELDFLTERFVYRQVSQYSRLYLNPPGTPTQISIIHNFNPQPSYITLYHQSRTFL